MPESRSTPVSLLHGSGTELSWAFAMREAYEKFLAQYGKTRSLSSAFRKDFFEAVHMVSFREKDHWLISGIRNRQVPYLLKGSAMGNMEEGS